MREPWKKVITVDNWYWEEFKLTLHWDSGLEDMYNAFILILRWLTFYKPEEHIMIKDSEAFGEYIDEIIKELKKDLT